MEASPNPSSSDSTMMLLSSGPMSHPTIRRNVFWALGIRTMADALPGPIQLVVNSGKMSVIVFLGSYFFFIGLWLPVWLFSFVVTEIGIYILFVGFVYLVGRGIIRMIAFPGSSNRVSSEIEKEFAKYSVKVIGSACNSAIDLASAINTAGNGNTAAAYEIPTLWKRVKSYRDRVLAVYADVLSYILHDGQQTSHGVDAGLTKYNNNRLAGDIGDLSGLTLEARADGKRLLEKLTQVLMELDRLESQAKPVLENTSGTTQPISSSLRMTANSLGIVADDLRNLVDSLRPLDPGAGGGNTPDLEDGEDVNMDTVRRRFEEQNTSLMESLKSGLSSILPMLDPPLHTSIFGFDLQRGCMLSRYRGARQLWVQRPTGGMVDVIHIPAKGSSTQSSQNSKAVLYCNPNAGLIEVAAGLSLVGGNVDTDGGENDNCWTDFYTNMGFDIYLFNYAGFGRSYGSGYCGLAKSGGEEPYVEGITGRIKRISHATFCGFQPTPETLRADGFAVANHIVSNLGVNNLIIHGESIGGIAASSTARQLHQAPFLRDKLALLICDRTFCNLEAVAQRLVGGWSGYAIRALAPLWSTDVANDFVNAGCPKIVANDAADAIIFDSASLRAGIAFWKEIYAGSSSTKGVGWIMPSPLHYRMAVDYENVTVYESRYAHSPAARRRPPTWPADKHISLEEGFHFAACVKRIGKLASLEKKKFTATDPEAAMGAVECPSPMYQIWKYLGTCEGMCGSPLGMAVRGGYDVTVSWLCSTLVFGGQTVVEGIEHRKKWNSQQASQSLHQLGNVEDQDFDCRPPDFEAEESDNVVHPKPITEVLATMKRHMEEDSNDECIQTVRHELEFVVSTLEYVVARLSSPQVLESNWKSRHLQDGQMMVGSFLNLHCGHNNPFSAVERERLRSLLAQATSPASQG